MPGNTLTALEEELISHFSPEKLHKITITGEGKKQKVFHEACDIPMLEGFCGDRNITLEELALQVSERVLKICELKQHNILAVNGLAKAYDASLTSLILKNKHNYSEKVEQTNRNQVTLSSEDKKLLEAMGIVRLDGTGKLIDVSDSVRV